MAGEASSASSASCGGGAAPSAEVERGHLVVVRRPGRGPVVERRLVHERRVRDLGDHLPVVLHAQQAVVVR
jgi:hypothetical protein